MILEVVVFNFGEVLYTFKQAMSGIAGNRLPLRPRRPPAVAYYAAHLLWQQRDREERGLRSKYDLQCRIEQSL